MSKQGYIALLTTGAASALWYFKRILIHTEAQWGRGVVPPLKVLSIPFKNINDLLPHKMQEAARALQLFTDELESMHPRASIMANITLHEALSLMSRPPASLIALSSIGREAAIKRNTRRAMVLGTSYTMGAGFVPSLFPESIDFFTPSRADAQAIDNLRVHIYSGDSKPGDEEVLTALKHHYPDVDTFVIACTELSIAAESLPQEHRVHFIDLPDLQCGSLVAQLRATDLFTATS